VGTIAARRLQSDIGLRTVDATMRSDYVRQHANDIDEVAWGNGTWQGKKNGEIVSGYEDIDDRTLIVNSD